MVCSDGPEHTCIPEDDHKDDNMDDSKFQYLLGCNVHEL